ncbi:MAG: sulfurtransferase TusA family protein [Gammaproteobacteria bacterium]|nr:sulfurtransferase TusA family protein [Gammaproteobacteria bacterium]
MSHHMLDATNLLCPMPVIRTQDRVAELEPGDILEVHCTDPGALHDIPAWCRVNGHHVVDTQQADNKIIVTLRVGS